MGFTHSRVRFHWAVVVLEPFLLLSLYLLYTLPGCSGEYSDRLKEFDHNMQQVKQMYKHWQGTLRCVDIAATCSSMHGVEVINIVGRHKQGR